MHILTNLLLLWFFYLNECHLHSPWDQSQEPVVLDLLTSFCYSPLVTDVYVLLLTLFQYFPSSSFLFLIIVIFYLLTKTLYDYLQLIPLALILLYVAKRLIF